ncbi:nitrile hydratase accessory protein [Shimia isoporae]|uniref:Nitrile hydratase accessory protein n=1 Tax=Shimia isoporae TaxID=647720 RepID=A0A4R1NL12_9RHOB|nr:nitrile hydratase accessory protein [Shimia isoporae]TCL09016.1 nitrile hydratase accessory protein [Shimia isoporae]
MSVRPEPAFEAPWHAQVFALTVAMNEAGQFAWTEWAETFGATLKTRGLAKELDGGDDYFNAWLEALETILRDKGLAAAADIEQMRAEWEGAYLSTPHGQPVRLPRG